MSKKRILGVIGLGHVGAHVAYALAVQGIADELILVDQNEKKLSSEVQDLRDAAAYLPHRVTVRAGSFPDLGVCDVIVNCVGRIELLRESHDRLTEMDYTIPAVRGYAHKIRESGFDGVLINITNPCDIVTRAGTGAWIAAGGVFGTGTGLDTSRLLSALARQTGIDHKSITCYMLGEHGNQQFAPWSCVSFRGMPLYVWAERDERFRFDRMALRRSPSAADGSHSPGSSVRNTALRQPQRGWRTSCCTMKRPSCRPARSFAVSMVRQGLFAGVALRDRGEWCGAGD